MLESCRVRGFVFVMSHLPIVLNIHPPLILSMAPNRRVGRNSGEPIRITEFRYAHHYSHVVSGNTASEPYFEVKNLPRSRMSWA